MAPRKHQVKIIKTIVVQTGRGDDDYESVDKASELDMAMEFVLEPIDVDHVKSPVVTGNWRTVRHKGNESVVIYSIYNVLHDDFKLDFETKVIPKMTELTRQETGCAAYDWFKDVDVNNTGAKNIYVCVEVFNNPDALNYHFTQAHTKALLKSCKPGGNIALTVVEARCNDETLFDHYDQDLEKWRMELKREMMNAPGEWPFDDETIFGLNFLKSELGHHGYLNKHEKDQLVMLKEFVVADSATPEKVNESFHKHLEHIASGKDGEVFKSKLLSNQVIKETDNVEWVWFNHCSSTDVALKYHEKNGKNDFFMDAKDAKEMSPSMVSNRLLRVLDFHLSTHNPLSTGHWNSGMVANICIYTLTSADYESEMELRLLPQVIKGTRARSGCVAYDWFKQVDQRMKVNSVPNFLSGANLDFPERPTYVCFEVFENEKEY